MDRPRLAASASPIETDVLRGGEPTVDQRELDPVPREGRPPRIAIPLLTRTFDDLVD